MNYTDFLVLKLERQSPRQLAQNYTQAISMMKSKNYGERIIGTTYLSAISLVLKPKDDLFRTSFYNYRRVWDE